MKITMIQLCCILFLFLNTSCMVQKDELIDTKWVYDFDDCQDYWKFKEQNKYEFYSCETGDTTYGTYVLENNTLRVHQVKGSHDQEFSEKSRHRTPNIKFELEINDNGMVFKERWETDPQGNWTKSDFTFPEDYVFKKQ